MKNRVVASALAISLLAGLAACGTALPTPHPAPSSIEAQPIVTIQRLDAISERIGNELTLVDEAKDASQLDSVTLGPARVIREAEYKIAAATKSADEITVIPTVLQSQMIPTTPQWPRTMMAVTVQPESLQSPRLIVLEQDTARANFRLWGWVRLFPAVKLPAVASAQTGTEAVTNDEGLSAGVLDVVGQYSDFLNQESASKYAATFSGSNGKTPDVFAAQRFANRKAMTKALKGIKGKFTETFSAPKDLTGTRAIRTQDGGALVVAALTSTDKFKGPKGSKIPPDAPTKALLPAGAKTSNALTISYSAVVSMYIPPKGSANSVQIVGVEMRPVAATIP